MNDQSISDTIWRSLKTAYTYLLEHKAVTLLLLAGIASVVIRILYNLKIQNSAVLYVAIPYLITLGLLVFTKSPSKKDFGSSYLRLMRESMIVLLGTSVFLQEGFLCVLFFIPIYVVIVTMIYIFSALFQYTKSRKGKVTISIFPALVLLSSLEGVVPEYSFPTRYSVSATEILPYTPEQIKQNLIKPMHIKESDNALLSLFPMPYRIEAGSLTPGDVHGVYYRYDKWIVANAHEGVVELRVAEVSENEIKMDVLEDSSYISNYMHAISTHISMRPVDGRHTEVTLTVTFDRLLSPAWYFGPLESYAVKKMSELLLKEVVAHG